MAIMDYRIVSGFKKEGMVAYYGPGDTVTSFYSIVGERTEFSLNRGSTVNH